MLLHTCQNYNEKIMTGNFLSEIINPENNALNIDDLYKTDTWIIYRGKKHGLSKIIRDAYRDYGNMEFGIKNKEKHLNNEERHVKLISVTGTQVKHDSKSSPAFN